MKRMIVVLFLMSLCSHILFGETTKKRNAASKVSSQILDGLQQQLRHLQETVNRQEQQLQQLRQELDRERSVGKSAQEVSGVRESAREAEAKAEIAESASIHNAQNIENIRNDLATVKSASGDAMKVIQEAEKNLANPVQIRFRGISLIPGGFIEAVGLYRTHNENADVGSTFGNIPFSGTANSHLSEFRGTARQSRLSIVGEGRIKDTKVSGYYEMDFLGAAPTGNEIESNSFNIRQRQLWGQAEFRNGFSMLAGQSWSLLTTSKKGIIPRQEFIPATIDAQYAVGYNWARQWGIRFTQRFTPNVWAGFAIENPETTISVINPPANVFGFNTSTNAQSPGSLFTLNNTPGANGVSTDTAPDFVGKLAFEPGWGHYEIKALARVFRDRVSSKNNVTAGGGLGLGAILPATKKVDVIVESLIGNGIGRYASSVGADVTLRLDGSIVPIRAFQTLAGIEAHPGPKLDIYIYGGEEYYSRTAYMSSTGRGVGYGSPLNNNSGCSLEVPSATQVCQAQTKSIWQVQPGFWYRFYKGTAGIVQTGFSYSYTYKNSWVGLGGAPKGIENTIMTSFRYYLP